MSWALFFFKIARQGTCPPVPHPQTESNLILFSSVFYYTVTEAADKRQKDLVTVSVRGGWRRGKLVLSWVVVRSWSRSGLSQPPIVVHLINSIVLHLADIGRQLDHNEHCTTQWPPFTTPLSSADMFSVTNQGCSYWKTVTIQAKVSVMWAQWYIFSVILSAVGIVAVWEWTVCCFYAPLFLLC